MEIDTFRLGRSEHIDFPYGTSTWINYLWSISVYTDLKEQHGCKSVKRNDTTDNGRLKSVIVYQSVLNYTL